MLRSGRLHPASTGRTSIIAAAKFRPQSRIGKKPIDIPQDVTVSLKDRIVEVKGPKGELSREFHKLVSLRQEEGRLLVERNADSKVASAMHGLWRALCANMVEGVSTGFRKQLELKGVGFRASGTATELSLSIGFSHPVIIKLPEGVTATVENNTIITIEGIDKEAVGTLAARIREKRPPEPYKGKGIRYLGEHIVLKPGKSA